MSDWLTARVPSGNGPVSLGRYALLLIVVAALQSAVLGWMIRDRVNLLATGREVVLDVVPVDPRSLFRGDYVILNYPVASIGPEVQGIGQTFSRGERVYVTLSRGNAAGSEASWEPASVSRVYPENAGPDRVVLLGRVRREGTTLVVRYGIESYFLPEGEGKALEQQVRERKLQVLVAVAADGEAAIKGLLSDGELRYEEPLF